MAAQGSAKSKGEATGLCECGCGEMAPLAKRTKNKIGHKKGQPVRFIRGHQFRQFHVPVEVRLDQNVIELETGCRIWQGSKVGAGYGVVSTGNRRVYVHRLAYELANGPIPEGLEIDHLCAVKDCVNPEHLEAVTHAENMRRLGERLRHG